MVNGLKNLTFFFIYVDRRLIFFFFLYIYIFRFFLKKIKTKLLAWSISIPHPSDIESLGFGGKELFWQLTRETCPFLTWIVLWIVSVSDDISFFLNFFLCMDPTGEHPSSFRGHH